MVSDREIRGERRTRKRARKERKADKEGLRGEGRVDEDRDTGR